MKFQLSLVLVFCAQILLLEAASMDGDYFNPDAEEQAKIKELKGLVGARVTHKDMKNDDYLFRFLREQDMDVSKAQAMFLKMLRWRDENKIEGILEETNKDFERFDKEFPGDLEGCDLAGRPVIAVKASDGDVAVEVLKPGMDKILKRYTLQTLEKAAGMLWAMNKEGQKVSQVTVLVDLDGFTVASHACGACIPIYLDVLDKFQANYPGYIHRIVAINTPKYAMPLWNTYKSAATQRLRDTVKIFGNDKNEWETYLQGEIAPAERTAHYGGTKAKGIPLVDLYKSAKVFKCSTPYSEYGIAA